MAILAVFFIANRGTNNLTTALVMGQTECVSPSEALKLIDEQGCERIYEDQKCAEQGKVELKCPW